MASALVTVGLFFNDEPTVNSKDELTVMATSDGPTIPNPKSQMDFTGMLTMSSSAATSRVTEGSPQGTPLPDSTYPIVGKTETRSRAQPIGINVIF